MRLRVNSRTFRTNAEELQLMIEILEAGFLADFVLELMDRAGSFDGLDAAATGADQVIAMLARNQQREVCGALVQAEAADDAVLSEPLEQAKNRGLVALVGEALGSREFR